MNYKYTRFIQYFVGLAHCLAQKESFSQQLPFKDTFYGTKDVSCDRLDFFLKMSGCKYSIISLLTFVMPFMSNAMCNIYE